MTLTHRTLALRVVFLVLLAVAAWRIASPETFTVGPAELRVRVHPAIPGGTTTLGLGPFGELSWPTHTAPLAVEATPIITGAPGDLPDARAIGGLVRAYAVGKLPWVVLAGALAGALIAVGHGRRTSLIAAGAGAAAAVALGAAVGGASLMTYSPGGFDHPRYQGPIDDAPRVLQLLQEVRGDFEGVRRNINRAVAGLLRVHAQVVAGSRPESSGEVVRFLAVADLHNNPLGLLIAKELIERFEVDALLNGGDFTDRGTGPEVELFARFADLGVPHLIAPGNHEDTAALEAAQQMPGVILLEGAARHGENRDLAEVGGVRILGEADPNAYSIESDPDNEIARQRMPELCLRLALRWRETRAEMILVHDPRLAECAIEEARVLNQPLTLVWGHLHRSAYADHGPLVSVSPGTSGAHGLKSDTEGAYGFALIEMEPGAARAASVCLISFSAPGSLSEASCHFPPPHAAAAG